MESFFQSLPKPLLALLVLSAAVAFFLFANPPHTICDAQLEAIKTAQTGSLFPAKILVRGKEQRIPPKLNQVKEVCQLGNSPGSCYEYFTALRSLAVDIGKGSSECTGKIFAVPEIQKALQDGVEVMARIAWGSRPPEPGIERFGWLQETELAIYCRLRNIYIRAVGEPGWEQLRRMVYTKLPGEALPPSTDPSKSTLEPRTAPQMLSEMDIWGRSLFSLRCESYL